LAGRAANALGAAAATGRDTGATGRDTGATGRDTGATGAACGSMRCRILRSKLANLDLTMFDMTFVIYLRPVNFQRAKNSN
jgi:hypothetical protein